MQHAEMSDLCDVWCTFNPNVKQFSCCRPNSGSDQWNKFSRLDIFFISTSLLNKVRKTKMQAGFQSDHSFVWFDILMTDAPRGPGYWKFNTSHLNDKNFIIAAKALIDEMNQNIKLNPGLLWDKVRGGLVDFCKRYTNDKAKSTKKELDQTQNELNLLKNKIENADIIEGADIVKYRDLEMQIDDALKEKAVGACLRSKIR